MKFKDKVIVITGASSGIGMHSAQKFVENGGIVILIARRFDKLSEIKQNLLTFEKQIFIYQCDVSDKSQVHQTAKIILEKFNKIDILINNAGFVIYGKVIDLTIEEIESQMKTNYFGMIYCTKEFLPSMIKQNSGHIVNVASVAASFGIPGITSYCATKYAVLGFSEGLKHELHKTNVDVTVVSPIMVRTGLFDHPSFKNSTKFSTGISLSPETVANSVLNAANSSRLEIVVPSIVRVGIWLKQTFPFLINPLIGKIFRRQLENDD